MKYRIFEKNGEFGFEILGKSGNIIVRRYGFSTRAYAMQVAQNW